jgi:hypothetical protein
MGTVESIPDEDIPSTGIFTPSPEGTAVSIKANVDDQFNFLEVRFNLDWRWGAHHFKCLLLVEYLISPPLTLLIANFQVLGTGAFSTVYRGFRKVWLPIDLLCSLLQENKINNE